MLAATNGGQFPVQAAKSAQKKTGKTKPGKVQRSLEEKEKGEAPKAKVLNFSHPAHEVSEKKFAGVSGPDTKRPPKKGVWDKVIRKPPSEAKARASPQVIPAS